MKKRTLDTARKPYAGEDFFLGSMFLHGGFSLVGPRWNLMVAVLVLAVRLGPTAFNG